MDERLRRRLWAVTKATRRRTEGSPSRSRAALFVLGCQRSGTTMLVDALDKDWRVKTFQEFSSVNRPAQGRRPWSIRSTSRYDIRLRPLDQVAAKLDGTRYPLVVLKPLVESQRAPEILQSIDRAVCVWVFRHYRDVSRSNVKLFTPGVNRINLEPMIRPELGNWRSELVPSDVRELIARHYAPDMNPFDGGALFWYARNRIFFELDLRKDERVMPLKYEDLTTEPARIMRAVYAHAGLSFPGRRLIAGIHPRSIGLGEAIELAPDIQEACERLWDELVRASQNHLTRAQAPVGV